VSGQGQYRWAVGAVLVAMQPALCPSYKIKAEHTTVLPGGCRRALRGVVTRAQSANDEKLLANPHLQVGSVTRAVNPCVGAFVACAPCFLHVGWDERRCRAQTLLGAV